jgi:hypothetical protein
MSGIQMPGIQIPTVNTILTAPTNVGKILVCFRK